MTVAPCLSMMEGGDTTLPTSPDSLDLAARHLDKILTSDNVMTSLADKLCSAGGNLATGGLSGLQDRDYPLASQTGAEAVALKQFTRVKRVPLPAELVEHFGHMQCNCNMGIFPQVSRAWLTIDSDIYLWRYEDGGDLAFFDGLTDTILNVCLVTPKPGILQSHIKYLLCLSTPAEIVLLGVSFTTPKGGPTEELHLLPEPLFTLPCEQLVTKSLQGTANGRIFMGGKDGRLYEFGYQSQQGWFGKKSTKINHSDGKFSWIMPSFGFAEEDPILQIEVDNSRNILYTRSEKGTITVYDMGSDSEGLDKVVSVSAQRIFEESSRLAATVETSNLKPIVHIAPIQNSEDDRLHLVALTAGGSRLFLSTRNPADNNPNPRPYCLRLASIRLPPGFAPSGPTQKPTKVHNGYYASGLTVLASSPAEAADVLWLVWNGSLPQSGNNLMEAHTVVPVEGHTWALAEVKSESKLINLFRRSYNGREPPSVVIQHFAEPRQMVLLSAQGSIIVNIIRPVDSLRQLLIDCGGPEAEAVKSYFSLLTPEQATATALILATSQALVDRQVAEWSAKALMLYGGEPKLHFPSQYGAAVGGFGGSGQVGYQSGYPASPGFQGNATGAAGFSMYQSPGSQYHGAGKDMYQIGSPSFVSSPSGFNPNLISTPQVNSSGYPGYHHQQTAAGQPAGPGGYHPLPEVMYSPRHNGLYLYISRVVRPLWSQPLVTGPGDKPASIVSGVEVEFIISHLQNIKLFLEQHTNLIGSSGEQLNYSQQLRGHQLSGQQQQQQRGQQDALLREKQSLLMVRQLVVHTLQVLGLWMVVVDHQVDQVLSSLSNDNKNLLRQLVLRDIVVTSAGRDICVSLVQGLIQRYLGDSANTDAISNKLREVCPGLYRVEDAASSKAHELLLAAAQSGKPAERSRMVAEAVDIAKGIAGSLRLDVMVSHLTAVHAYKSVVEVCLAAAAKKDPQGLAVHFYQHGENMEDTAGLSAYTARCECYRHCTRMLETLLSSSNNIQTSPSVPKTPGPAPPADPSQLQPVQAGEWAEQVFQMMVSSDDEILHATLYQWLIDNRYTDRLLSIKSPYLESYLKRGIAQHPDQLHLFDIIWKYYEKNGSYLLAAKILDKLSGRHSTELNLQSRVEYLSRAIMCVKSVEGENSRSIGQLLTELEEKMEVARVQLMVLEAASNIPAASASLSRLNSDLLDITTLYQDWAEPYQLWECKLAILATAGHPDPMLIQNIWTNIIDQELDRMVNNLDVAAKKRSISCKIESLGRLYSSSSKYFPLEFLVRKLELFSCKHGGGEYTWVPHCLQKIGVDLPRLLDVYNRIYLAKDSMWLTAGDELHILHVLAAVLNMFVESPLSVASGADRRQFTVVCQDAVSAYLGELYMKQTEDTALMITRFRDIQARLDRLKY